MTVKTAIQLLKRHNKWRRGDEKIMMVNPETLGKAIDTVVKELENHGDIHDVVGRSEQLCECKIKTLPDGNIRLTMCKKCVEEEGLA